MTGDSGRWVEVTSSQFAHEADGLDLVRHLLPDETPYRAWSNFEFRDAHGRWHEIDLLVLGRDGFHLVELKYYSGTIRGNDLTWLRDGHRAEDSPLKLARRKAQYFASKLKDEYLAWVREKRIAGAAPANEVIPWVQESVFLHHERVRVDLPDSAKRDLYGLDDFETTSGLPGISTLLTRPSGPGRPIGPNTEAILVALLARIGLVQRREREAGSWVLEGGAIAEGDGWQDWLATHKVSQTERRRIRFQTLPSGASAAERHRVRQLAEHEYRTLRRLTHQGVLRPDDLVECDLGIGLVYPYDPDQQPLDLWLADRPGGVPLETQLAIVRQVGDALSYAHSNRLVHRGLSPRAVLVSDKNGRLRVVVADWQSVGAVAAAGTPTAGVTALFGTDAATPTPDGELASGGVRRSRGRLRAGHGSRPPRRVRAGRADLLRARWCPRSPDNCGTARTARPPERSGPLDRTTGGVARPEGSGPQGHPPARQRPDGGRSRVPRRSGRLRDARP